jgi:hypothetical protein
LIRLRLSQQAPAPPRLRASALLPRRHYTVPGLPGAVPGAPVLRPDPPAAAPHTQTRGVRRRPGLECVGTAVAAASPASASGVGVWCRRWLDCLDRFHWPQRRLAHEQTRRLPVSVDGHRCLLVLSVVLPSVGREAPERLFFSVQST